MLILDIAIRFIRETSRLKISLTVMILMPAFMAFMFWFTFSTIGLGGAETYQIGVINNDKGINDDLATYIIKEDLINYLPFNESTLESGFAHDFIIILNSSKYPVEEGEPTKRIFFVTAFNNHEDAIEAVEEREIDALIIFPEDYSNTTLSVFNNAFYIQNGIYIQNFPIYSNSSINVIGDEGYSRYQIVSLILTNVFSVFNEQMQAFRYPGGNMVFEINSVTLKEYSLFDTIMPGILVFAALIQVGMLAAFLVTEIAETKTITRIRLSLIKPYEYIIGVTIFSFVTSFIQLSILFGFSILILGFRPAGNIFEAMIILMLIIIFTTALSFVLAGIFKSADAAGQSSGFLMTPLAFMSGAFMDVPKITLIPAIIPTSSGLNRDFVLWDILPSTHAVNSLRSVLLYEFSILDVWADIILIIIPSVILLFFGMIFYTKMRFSGDIIQ